MDFYGVIQKGRSIRSFKKDLVPRKVLDRVLEAIRIALSGSNRQPWKFILVKDESLKEKMVSACQNQHFIADARATITLTQLISKDKLVQAV